MVYKEPNEKFSGMPAEFNYFMSNPLALYKKTLTYKIKLQNEPNQPT